MIPDLLMQFNAMDSLVPHLQLAGMLFCPAYFSIFLSSYIHILFTRRW